MEQPVIASLLAAWQKLPGDLRYSPASQAQVDAFEQKFGAIPLDYRQFLLKFGGGAVGSEWLDGIEKLPLTHSKFLQECGPDGWQLADAFVIGWDGAGNPMAIDASGAVVVEDHNFGGIHRLAPSFEAYLAKGLGHEL